MCVLCRQQWWVGRQVVLAALTVVVLAPLSSFRTMGHLGAINRVGLASLAGFAGVTIWLVRRVAWEGSWSWNKKDWRLSGVQGGCGRDASACWLPYCLPRTQHRQP